MTDVITVLIIVGLVIGSVWIYIWEAGRMYRRVDKETHDQRSADFIELCNKIRGTENGTDIQMDCEDVAGYQANGTVDQDTEG